MNLKRGFHRILLVLATLWFIPSIVLTVVLMPPKQDALIITEGERLLLTQFQSEDLPKEGVRLDDLEAVTQLEERGMITHEEAKKVLGKCGLIRALQGIGKLPSDPNLIYKPPSFWQSEDGKNLIQKYNDKMLLKCNIRHIVLFIFTGFLLWLIPLALVYLIGLIIRWIAIGFRGSDQGG